MLVEVVKRNKNIIEYDLSWNRFTPAQVAILIDTLQIHSSHVKYLNLSFVPID